MRCLLIVWLVALILLAGCGSGRIGKAEELIKVGDTANAIVLLTEEVKDNPRNGYAHALLGIIYERSGEWDKAGSCFEVACKINPDISKEIAQYLIDRCERKPCKMGNLTLDPLPKEEDIEAFAYYERALKYNPPMGNDEEFCYRYYVKTESDPYTFTVKFPKSRYIPEAKLVFALNQRDVGFIDEAKRVLLEITKLYPDSPQASEAKKVLSNWWTETTQEIPLYQGRHAVFGPFEKGQEIQIRIPEKYNQNLGLFGNRTIDGKAVRGYFGSLNEWQEMISTRGYNIFSWSSREEHPENLPANEREIVSKFRQAFRIGEYWSGVVPKNAHLIVWTDLEMLDEINKFTITVRAKDLFKK